MGAQLFGVIVGQARASCFVFELASPAAAEAWEVATLRLTVYLMAHLLPFEARLSKHGFVDPLGNRNTKPDLTLRTLSSNQMLPSEDEQPPSKANARGSMLVWDSASQQAQYFWLG